jgi:hypothetical protein
MHVRRFYGRLFVLASVGNLCGMSSRWRAVYPGLAMRVVNRNDCLHPCGIGRMLDTANWAARFARTRTGIMVRLSPICGSVIVAVCLAATIGCDRGAETPTFPHPNVLETAGETLMSQEHDWNDEARDELRATLQWFILGEVRLAKYDYEEILETCREVYILDECPQSEESTFTQFAADELNRVIAQVETEKSAWPAETDCDRLDRVEAALRERGILLWQVSPCCDTCTVSELPDRIDAVNRRHPGFRDRIRGYCFFIDQNMPEMLSDSTELSVYWVTVGSRQITRTSLQKSTRRTHLQLLARFPNACATRVLRLIGTAILPARSASRSTGSAARCSIKRWLAIAAEGVESSNPSAS